MGSTFRTGFTQPPGPSGWTSSVQHLDCPCSENHRRGRLGGAPTAMCGPLAASHRGIPVGHGGAGWGTGNRRSPFPEEITRRLTTAVTDYHFAPMPRARDTLLAEGVPNDRILVTGNTV